MNIQRILCVALCVLFGMNCKTKDSNNKSDPKDFNGSTTIAFKLKQREIFKFAYVDSFFNYNELTFSNPGNVDSVFFQTIEIGKPTVLTSVMVRHEVNGEVKKMSYYFMLLPGDTVAFSLDRHYYLDVDVAHKKDIISFPDTTTNTSLVPFDKQKKITTKNAWEQQYNIFYSGLLKEKDATKRNYDSLLSLKIIDSVRHRMYLQHAQMQFYTQYFVYFSKSEKIAEDVIKNNLEMENALAFLNTPQYMIARNPADIFRGILQFKLINKKKDFNNKYLLYEEATHSNITTLRPALLSYFLTWNPDNVDTVFFNLVAKQIVTEYKGTAYEKNCINLQRKIKLDNNTNVADSIIGLNKIKASWQDIIPSSNNTITLVDFWASWCSPCRAQLPLLAKIKTQFKNSNIRFVSINIDERVDDWIMASKAEAASLGEHNYHLIIHNKDKSLVKKWKINSIPRYMLFKNGSFLSRDFTNPAEPGFAKELKKIVDANK